jgi:hypothetical protein
MASTRLIKNRESMCDLQRSANYYLEQPCIHPAITNDITIFQQWSSLSKNAIDIESSLKGLDQLHKREKRQTIIRPIQELNNSPEVIPTVVSNKYYNNPCLIKDSRKYIKDTAPDSKVSIFNLQDFVLNDNPPIVDTRWIDR